MIRNAMAALALIVSLAGAATAQDAPAPADPRVPTVAELNRRYVRSIPTDPSDPDYYEPAHRSILRYRAMPAPAQTRESDRREESSRAARARNEGYGVRNPGNVGRRAEYYPPGDRFQNDGDPVRVAGFDTGAGPDRADQLEAARAGTERYNAIRRSIDNQARPAFGYGFGFGLGSGFGFGPVFP